MASWSVTRHLSSLLAHSIIATSSATWSYTRSLFVGRQEGTQSWATSARRCGGRWRERGGGTADLRKASRATARRHWRRHPAPPPTASSGVSRIVHAAREDGSESRQRQPLPSGVQMAFVAIEVGVDSDLAAAAASTTAPRREMHSTAASAPSRWANCGTE